MTQRRRPRKDLPEFAQALRDAHREELREDGTYAPQPLCLDNPGPWTDYGYPLPTARQAEALCAPCPLLEMCRSTAKHRQPHWGVQGGITWIQGRQAHLLSPDDPRLQDPDAEDFGVSPQNSPTDDVSET